MIIRCFFLFQSINILESNLKSLFRTWFDLLWKWHTWHTVDVFLKPFITRLHWLIMFFSVSLTVSWLEQWSMMVWLQSWRAWATLLAWWFLYDFIYIKVDLDLLTFLPNEELNWPAHRGPCALTKDKLPILASNCPTAPCLSPLLPSLFTVTLICF